MRAFLFPGQGSQVVGMGKSLYDTFRDAKDVFQEVDEALKQNLSKIIFNGDQETLSQTANTQPALMAVSMACTRVLEKQGGKTLPKLGNFMAGHSLGEYSALCAGDSFDLTTTATLLRIRGNAMQEAVPMGQGGMTALIGATLEQAEELAQSCALGDILEVANDNAPGQVVISGHIAALERCENIAADKGIKRVVRLGVSAPFHSSLMKPAALKMQDALSSLCTINMPSLTLISNVTATELEEKQQISERLVQQVTKRVRWVESIHNLVSKGVTEFVELGSGKVLSGLVKRINRDVITTNLETPTQIEDFLKNT